MRLEKINSLAKLSNQLHTTYVVCFSIPKNKKEFPLFREIVSCFDLNTVSALTLQVTDLPEEDLLSHFQSSNAFIEDGLSKDGAVLVHCYRGRSRSATVIGKKYAFTKYPPPHIQKKTLQKVYYFS